MEKPTRAELLKLVKEMLSYFPDRKVVEALKADSGYGHRLMPLLKNPKDDILDRWLRTVGR